MIVIVAKYFKCINLRIENNRCKANKTHTNVQDNAPDAKHSF